MRPVAAHIWEDVLEAMHTALCKLAECGDLAPKNVEKRGVVGLIKIENIIARNGGRVALAIGEQVIDFFFVRAHVFGSAFISNIGCADECFVAFIWIDEDYALVVVLNQISIRTRPELWHDDVAALDQTHIARRIRSSHIGDNVSNPRTCAIDDAACAEAAHFAGIAVLGFNNPAAFFATCGSNRRTGQNGGTFFGGTYGIEYDETGVIDPAI